MSNINEAAEKFMNEIPFALRSYKHKEGFIVGALSDAAKEYWHNQFQLEQSNGVSVWVKASTRLPKSIDFGLLVRYNFNGRFWDKELGDSRLVLSLIENGWQDIEWLDEQAITNTQKVVNDEDKKHWAFESIGENSDITDDLLKSPSTITDESIEALAEKEYELLTAPNYFSEGVKSKFITAFIKGYKAALNNKH